MARLGIAAGALLAALLVPGPAPTAGAAEDAARGTPPARVLLEGLDYPWDIEARDGVIHITEKAGTLGRLDAEGFTRLPVQTRVPILDDRGGGLMGLALVPGRDDRVVLYHHAGTPEARFNRVIEAELRPGPDGTPGAWHEIRVLRDDIPGHPLYNGGRVAFGPDGMLYVTTGWTADPALPRDPDSLAGKVLRLTPDGGIPADNPRPGSPVWSLGHRNPQGLAFAPDGQLYVAEHGASGGDEVNRVVAGGDYGWPDIRGAETAPGLIAPLAQSGHDTWAPSGMTWSGAWPGGRLLVAGLRSGSVLAVTPDGTVSELVRAGDRLRDIAVIDGRIHAITTRRSPRRDGPSDDRLLLLTPTPE